MIKELLPPSTKRVKYHTKERINREIYNRTRDNILKHSNKSREDISNRIEELNNEWDTERVLEANAAALIFISTGLGYFFNPLWLLLTAAVSFFLFEHAVQGWCPPLPIIRRLGIRTPSEIDEEKIALRILRGDLSNIKGTQDIIDKSLEN